MKYYLYIPSYTTIRQYLYLKKKFKDIKLVSRNTDLIKFAQYMEWHILDFSEEYHQPPNNTLNIFRKFKNHIEFRERLNDNIDFSISRLDSGTFYFSTLLIDHWVLKFVQRLSFKNSMKIIYLDDTKVTMIYKKATNISLSERFVQFHSRLLYFLPLKWFDSAGGHYLGVDYNFLRRYGISHDKSLDPFYSNVEIPQLPTKALIDVLIIGGQKIDENSQFFNCDSIKAVYKFIKKIRPDTYFKYHPGEVVPDDLSDSFNQVEPFIPVEFLHKTIKIALGDFSYALVGLSLQGVLCISYLNLLEAYPIFDKEFWVRKLNEDSNGKIRFVNSFDELANLLKNNIAERINKNFSVFRGAL